MAWAVAMAEAIRTTGSSNLTVRQRLEAQAARLDVMCSYHHRRSIYLRQNQNLCHLPAAWDPVRRPMWVWMTSWHLCVQQGDAQCWTTVGGPTRTCTNATPTLR